MRKILLSVAILAALVGVGVVLAQRYPEIAESWLGKTPLRALVGETQALYMWRNRQGQWQATDKPPPEGVPFEVKRYPIDANIVPSPPRNDQ